MDRMFCPDYSEMSSFVSVGTIHDFARIDGESNSTDQFLVSLSEALYVVLPSS